VAGARHAGGAQHLLHARLVAEVHRRLDRQPGQPEPLAQLRERHLELLVRAEQPLGAPQPVGERVDRAGELIEVGDVVHAPVLGDGGPHLGRRVLLRVLRHHAEPHAGERRRGRDHAGGGRRQVRRGEEDGGHGRRERGGRGAAKGDGAVSPARPPHEPRPM
jgi:hypothetical protein